MKERIEKIKAHIYRHRVAYSCTATGVVVAGFTFFIMRGRYAIVGNAALDGLDGVTVRPLSILSNQTNTIVAVIEREGRGHPGYIVKCVETGIYFITQGEAARSVGVDSSVMSRHLNGILEDAGGLHFERIGEVA